jgi:uncharacterized protein YndB with AHSA1/START domain
MTEATDEETTVRKEVVVPAEPDLAFHVFTARFGDWWPDHHLSDEPVREYVLEGGEGGRWYERAESGQECEWGRVLRWDPPRHLVMTWAISAEWEADGHHASEVHVWFDAVDGGTRVRLEHRHLDRAGERWRRMRDQVDGENGWGTILLGYVRAVG